jgi:hypothetical protein
MIAAIRLPFRPQSLLCSFFRSLPLHFFSCEPRLPGLCPEASMSLASNASTSTTRSDSTIETRLCRARSAYTPVGDNPFKIRTSAKDTRKPFRICTSKTRHLKSFRIRSYKKTGRGRAPVTVTSSPRVSVHSAPLRYLFSFPLATHYSLLTSSILCLSLVFLLSSAPNRENANVSK